MAGAEQGDIERCMLLLDRLPAREFEQHRAAATLPERVAERELPLPAGFAREGHLPRDLERRVLEVAAPDRAVRLRGADPHARAGVARCRAAGFPPQYLNPA